MNLPDWLSLSATSGTGSSKITATVDKCTARAARRTTEFSVKTDSGSSRRVRVIQNGIAEFVNITTPDITIPAVVTGQQYITIAGTSNSAILTVSTSGMIQLTPTVLTVIDKDNNSKSFVSGMPIDGDPGAEAAYSFSLTFSCVDNPTNEELRSAITVIAQNGVSASVNVLQAAGSHVDIDLPIFTNTQIRNISSFATDAILPEIIVYDPNDVGWDIVVTSDTATVAISKGTESDHMTPVAVTIDENTDTERVRSILLYLVPVGAQTTSIVYSTIQVIQAAAPVNPYIEGDSATTSYAGGLVILNVVDQKGVGWYPQYIYDMFVGDPSATTSEALDCTMLITGKADNRSEPYVDADSNTIFSNETGNTKIVGDGIIKLHINAAANTNDMVTVNLRVSKNDLETEAYDYVAITISNIPQFDTQAFDVVIPPTRAYVDNAYLDEIGAQQLTIGNPNNVPFVITMSNNGPSTRKATIMANNSVIYDETEGVAPAVFTDAVMTLSVNASQLGRFYVYIKSQDGSTVFSTLVFTVYRQPVIKFAYESDGEITLHVSEPLPNAASVYSRYAGYEQGQYSASDLLSAQGGNISYSIVDGDASAILLDGSTVIGHQVLANNSAQSVTIRAELPADESSFYTEASAEYTVSVVRTNARLFISNFEDGTETIKLWFPDFSPEYPQSKTINYRIMVDKYSAYQVFDTVDMNVGFPGDNLNVQFVETSEGGVGYIDTQDLALGVVTAIKKMNDPALEHTAISIVNTYNNHIVVQGTQSRNLVFYVEVHSNPNYVFQVTLTNGVYEYDEFGNQYLFYEAGPGGTTTPRNFTLKLLNGTEGNYVEVPCTIQFAIDKVAEEISYEQSDRLVYSDMFTIYRTNNTSPINTPATEHSIDVALLSNNTGDHRSRYFYIKAYVDGATLGDAFKVSMTQKEDQGEAYTLAVNGSEAEQWIYDRIPISGIPSFANSREFPLALQYHGTGTPLYSIDDKTLTPTFEYYVYDETYVDPYDSNNKWRPATNDSDPKGWMSLEPSGGGYEITTDSNGEATPTLSWLANTESSVYRACVITINCTLNVNPARTSQPLVLPMIKQYDSSPRFRVEIHDSNDTLVANPIRTMEVGDADESAVYVGAAYLTDSTGDNRISTGLQLTYTSSAPEVISVDEYGKLTVLVEEDELDSIVPQVFITVTGEYESDGILYDAYVQYVVNIEVPKLVATIEHNATEISATYGDAGGHELWARADSGAVVTIVPTQETASRISITNTSVEKVGNINTTYIYFDVLAAGLVEFTMNAPATDTHDSASTSATINIAKKFDYVTSWTSVDNSGFTVEKGDTKTYDLTTASGLDPKSLTVQSGSGNAQLTWPVSGNKKRFNIKGLVSKTSFTIIANLEHDSNYRGPTQDEEYLNICQFYINGLTQRTVSFDKATESVEVFDNTVKIYYTFDPTSDKSGAKEWTNLADKLQLVSNSSNYSTFRAIAVGDCYPKLKVGATSTSTDCTTAANSLKVSVGKTNPSVSYTPNPIQVGVEQQTTINFTHSGNAEIKDAGPQYLNDFNYFRVVSYSGNSVIIEGKQDSGGSTKNLSVTFRTTTNYKEYNMRVNVVVVPASQVQPTFTISYPNDSYSVQVGNTITPIPVYSPTQPLPSGVTATVTYAATGNNSSYVNVGELSGTITGVTATGSTPVLVEATVTATGYQPAKAQCYVSVTAAALLTNEIYIGTPAPYRIQIGETLDLQVSAKSGQGSTFEYSLSNGNITRNGDEVTGAAVGSTSVTIICKAAGYNDISRTISVVVYEQSGGGGEVEPDPDFIDYNYENNIVTIDGMLVNIPDVTSGREPSYTISDMSKARITTAVVTAKAAGSSTVTLTPSVSSAKSCTVSVANNNVSKNGQVITWDGSATTIALKTGDVIYLKSTYPTNPPSGTSFKWSSTAADKVLVKGGVITGVAYSAAGLLVTASVPLTSEWTAATSQMTIYVDKKTPQLVFTKYPEDGGQFFIIPKGDGNAVYDPDLNPLLSKGGSTGTVTYGIGPNRLQETGIVNVNALGQLIPNTNSGDVEVFADVQADSNYKAASASYLVRVTGYTIRLYKSGGSEQQTSATVGGLGGSVTMVVKYYMNDGSVQYSDDFEVLSGNMTSKSASGNPTIHTAMFYFGPNKSVAFQDSLSIKSIHGKAIATLPVWRNSGDDSGDPAYYQWKVTVATTMDDSALPFLPKSLNPYVEKGGSMPIYAATDESIQALFPNDDIALSNSTSGAKWMEVLEYNNVRKGSTYSIRYKSSDASWLKTYWGDGNSASADDDNYKVVPADGKLYPHLSWTANNTGQERQGYVDFYVAQGNEHLGTFRAYVWQPASNN